MNLVYKISMARYIFKIPTLSICSKFHAENFIILLMKYKDNSRYIILLVLPSNSSIRYFIQDTLI